ncbi:mannonate dehydratase [Alkalibacillus haloalkaliphilus]|uniref:Mannonate dehydratase n=1 Tax=Alkalibacillus haloalkaliphilus TaxID=94136 RepID=A0A511W5E5_9BACI|nr:mannonate dehydratase [Alkalibacillus haloalkaliphilus]GEN45991.1 mannonate dehydratase [Alkalibacillus haloalkaliphilus]
MEMTFRWYGHDDQVPLQYIRQIPSVTGIVSAVYDIPVGEVWPLERIEALKQEVESNGLNLSVIESVPVHEDIKLGLETRDHYIENYKQTIRNLSKAGVKTVCYNFMPVFDWTRTDLAKSLEDGSNSLNYDESELEGLDPLSGELTLPGWDLSYQTDELKGIMDQYKEMSEQQLLDNLVYFLKEIIPVAEEEDVLMAIHPDDPPWNIFGLPRVVTNAENVKYLLNAVDSKHNGLTFCTGSFGADQNNDLFEIIDVAKDRINFVHLRNVKRYGTKSFQEVSHQNKDGSLDMVGVIKKLKEVGFNGPARPDHGRMIFGEEGRPGYGLYDRALGAMYIAGVLDSIK